MPGISLPHVAMVLGAMFLIVAGDTAGKAMTGQGMNPVFVAWGRFALAALMLAPLAGLRREDLPAFLDWRLLLRTLFIVAGICAILTALRTEPIANVFGAFFISPVVSYFGSAAVLKERITVARSVLLLIGFAGVLLVVRPGFGMTPGMGFALFAGSGDAFAVLDPGEDERAISTHPGAVALHDREVGSDGIRQVGLVDHQEVGLGDSGAALARDLIAS